MLGVGGIAYAQTQVLPTWSLTPQGLDAGDKFGYHAGADLGFYPVRNLGFGILIGYRPNPLQIEVRDVAVDVGGSPLLVQAGARVRF